MRRVIASALAATPPAPAAPFAEVPGKAGEVNLLGAAVGWLVGQSDLLSIRARGLRASRVSLTQGEMQAVFYLSVLVLPELLLLAGLIVWWRRE